MYQCTPLQKSSQCRNTGDAAGTMTCLMHSSRNTGDACTLLLKTQCDGQHILLAVQGAVLALVVRQENTNLTLRLQPSTVETPATHALFSNSRASVPHKLQRALALSSCERVHSFSETKERVGTLPLSSDCDKQKTKAMIWPWISGKSPYTLVRCSLYARKRTVSFELREPLSTLK